ncbi:hypothetical protein BH18GEM1_BH18GEM1_15240 [soil metagenome]
MRISTLIFVGTSVVCTMSAVEPARAQEQEEPTIRYVAATSFDVPFYDREKVVSFLEEYFLPGYQLDPRIRNFRMLNHQWGSNASTIVLVAEYDSWADIEADCGQPCDDYDAQHEEPEEGDPGYAEYQEKQAAFQKYYAAHSDEIYTTSMSRAVVEGEMQGTVGPAPEEDE